MPLAVTSMLPQGWQIAGPELLWRTVGLVVIYLLFTAAQRAAVRSGFLRTVALQLNLLALILLIHVFLGSLLGRIHPDVLAVVRASGVFLCVTIGLKLADLFFFDRLPRWRGKPQVPLVLRDIARLLLALVALVLIIRGFFPEVNLNVLAVSSLVVGYIVGNATQDTLGNLFAGLALNAERPFQIGDWVTVAGHTGQVVDTTWRATRLRTKGEDYIIIPNSAIGKESITNFSRPTGLHACYLEVGVSYETPPNKARAAILEVLKETPEVCQKPTPSVYLISYGDFSINFRIKFFIEDFQRLDPIQSNVMDRLWYAFRREAISIPFPVHDERQRDAEAEAQAQQRVEREAIRQLLDQVELFHSFTPQEKDIVSQRAQFKPFASGEVIFHQGDPGDSFYIIWRGQAAVRVKSDHGEPMTVAQLGAGDCFGEMALLTGESRTATVLAETDLEVVRFTRPLFAELLQANRGLADQLARVLAQRAADLQAKKATLGETPRPTELSSALRDRILRFFGLQRPPSA